MKVFVTGASGFIGKAVVKELLANGHSVLGMARSDEGVSALQALGADVLRATIEETDKVLEGVNQSEGVIHLAFNHDFSRFLQNCEDDRKLVTAICAALEGTQKPMLTTSGILMADVAADGVATEDTPSKPSSVSPRAASEEAIHEAAKKGVRVSLVRLPQVHDIHRQGLISAAIELAKEKGEFAYVGDGENRIAAVSHDDIASLYRLALENAASGAVYNAVGEPGVKVKDIVETLGKRLNLPVKSIPAADAPAYFGWLNMYASSNVIGSSEQTQKVLNWHPNGPDLLSDLAKYPV